MITKTNFAKILFGIALTAGLLSARADEEQDLIAILNSNAGPAEKGAACVRLRSIGTAASVPALSALLREERTSHAARYALEENPAAESSEALRRALGLSSGTLKAGIVDSLGARKDGGSVALVAPLLSDSDPAVAASAARALGQIGNAEAVAALRMQGTAAPVAVHEALLNCAEVLRQSGAIESAREIYRQISEAPVAAPIRLAAWRGMVLASPERAGAIRGALVASDLRQKEAALKLVYELNDAAVLEECANAWEQLGAAGQLAIFNAQVKGRTDVLPLAMKASTSPHAAVRTAAWRAMADGDASMAIPALAHAAASGETAEKSAAYETLCRMSGEKTHAAIQNALPLAEISEKTELLRALGDRGDPRAGPVLLDHAHSGRPEAVRLASLESLRKIGSPDTLVPLIEIAANCRSDAECEPVMMSLEGLCRALSDKERATRGVLEAMASAKAPIRARLTVLLPELGTVSAQSALESAANGSNVEDAREAVRALSRWPTAAPARPLLALARTHTNAALQVLALRGSIDLAAHEPDLGKRAAVLKAALAAANRPTEMKQAIAALGTIPTVEALRLTEGALNRPEVADEAALATIVIAEKLAPAHPDLARECAERVLSQSEQPDLLQRAWKLRGKPAAGPFIQNWSMAGPFTKPGATGAPALFDAAFEPESPGAAVEWRPFPKSNQANLAALFPGRENSAAYLKTRIVAPERCKAALLLGSDDGVKAWLNGLVVHSNNTDRGDVPDQDVALIELKKGANELMLKISQGGGGWSAHARIVGNDGKPIPGLRDEP